MPYEQLMKSQGGFWSHFPPPPPQWIPIDDIYETEHAYKI